MTKGHDLHNEAIVIDAVCPLLMNKKYIEWYKEGGATAIAPTVASGENAGEALRAVGGWLRFVRNRDDLLLVRQAGDIERAKQAGKLGIFLHFQGTDPLENDIDLVDAFKAAGVGMLQLTYNVKNRVGDGASERTDSGLSYFGLEFVKRCNEVGVIVDCSHTGYRTTMDAIEASTKPVVFSHANAKAVAASPRNIADDQITGAKIVDATITDADLAPGLISSAFIAADAVQSNHIADGQVGGGQAGSVHAGDRGQVEVRDRFLDHDRGDLARVALGIEAPEEIARHDGEDHRRQQVQKPPGAGQAVCRGAHACLMPGLRRPRRGPCAGARGRRPAGAGR